MSVQQQDEHVLAWRAFKYRAEYIEDGNYAWHPDDPCLTLVHKIF